jgi:sulfatase maturation enzyme AslB (radical SAM superfamily)
MTLKNNFCSSPWINMRIGNTGNLEYCRWAIEQDPSQSENIRDIAPADFFQKSMVPVRQALLDGEALPRCGECYQMEQYHKVSGRQKQLLKTGVRLEHFEKTMASSPWVQEFSKHGATEQLPQDWQIELGNYCNSACVFCLPEFSSKLAMEHRQLGLITQMPPPSWTDDPNLVDRFIATLTQSPHIQYLHFIGGETLITPAFKTILTALVDSGMNKKVSLGFTTNLSVWREDIAELLVQFASVHLGMSLESFTSINDYVRWPVDLHTMNQMLSRWTELAKQHNWYITLRTTPTILSLSSLLTVYDYAWSQGISVESCNFLNRPEFMRPAVLPLEYRQQELAKLNAWIVQHSTDSSSANIINIRDPNVFQQQLVQDLQSYVNYLEAESDQSWRLPALVQYLKTLETRRGNSILDYLPEYEELFRSTGY